MKAAAIAAVLDPALQQLAQAREELRALDAAIGDGDLGITVAGGAEAVRGALAAQPPAAIGDLLRTVAKAFANANPSTMSGLVAAGLLAGARTVGPVDDLDRAGTIGLLGAVATAIGTRGGAQPGDKTILDALLPTVAALEQAGDVSDQEALASMIAAADGAVRDTAALQSRRGRAAWVGERTIGHADGGATAYLRFLQALAAAWPDTDAPLAP